jgi:hypothetical protein
MSASAVMHRRIIRRSFLAGLGIDQISVNPSSLPRTIALMREADRSTS